MIAMGAGTNHWFHSDQTYRTMLALVMFCGCQGVNGGGWAHYVGQEKVRPLTGWTTVAFGLDWSRPPRQQPATPYWYLATDQWRYETFGAGEFTSPAGNGALGRQAHRRLPRARRPARLAALLPDLRPQPARPRRRGAGRRARSRPSTSSTSSARAGSTSPAEDPDDPANFPRVLTLWRANLLGSSSKGHEYFLKHLLGVPDAAVRSPESRARAAPGGGQVARRGARGQARPVHDDRLPHERLLHLLRRRPARRHLVREARPLEHRPAPVRPSLQRGRAAALGGAHRLGRLQHDRRPLQRARREATSAPAPTSSPARCCTTRPTSSPSPAARCSTGAPASASRSRARRCRSWPRSSATTRRSPRRCGRSGRWSRRPGSAPRGSAGSRSPRSRSSAIATASPTAAAPPTGGRGWLATSRSARRSWRSRGRPTAASRSRASRRSSSASAGRSPQIPEERADDRITFADITIQPRKVIASAEWSGLESRERRYSPFTANVEHLIPWRTLTGRQQLYVDHEWMLDLGEGLPAYRPPVDAGQLVGLGGSPDAEDGLEITVRYVTPHSKWSIHSEFQDNLHDADPVPRRPGDVAVERGRRADRRRRQRLARGLQQARHRRLPCRRLAPDPQRRRLLLPLPGPPRQRARSPRSPAPAAAPTTR